MTIQNKNKKRLKAYEATISYLQPKKPFRDKIKVRGLGRVDLTFLSYQNSEKGIKRLLVGSYFVWGYSRSWLLST